MTHLAMPNQAGPKTFGRVKDPVNEARSPMSDSGIRCLEALPVLQGQW